MKTLLLLLVSISSSADCYETLDDSFHYADREIDTLKAHMDCYLDKSPCDNMSESIKQYIQHAVETSCVGCSEENKHSTWTFIQASRQYLPAELVEWQRKVDPANLYWDKFVEAVTPK